MDVHCHGGATVERKLGQGDGGGLEEEAGTSSGAALDAARAGEGLELVGRLQSGESRRDELGDAPATVQQLKTATAAACLLS